MNNNKCRCEFKNYHICEKDYVWNPATFNCENGENLANVMDDSAITCDEVIGSYAKLCSKDDKEKKILIKKYNL